MANHRLFYHFGWSKLFKNYFSNYCLSFHVLCSLQRKLLGKPMILGAKNYWLFLEILSLQIEYCEWHSSDNWTLKFYYVSFIWFHWFAEFILIVFLYLWLINYESYIMTISNKKLWSFGPQGLELTISLLIFKMKILEHIDLRYKMTTY